MRVSSSEGIKSALELAKRRAEGEVDIFHYTSAWLQQISTKSLTGLATVCLDQNSQLYIIANVSKDGIITPIQHINVDHIRVPLHRKPDSINTILDRIDNIFLKCFGNGIIYIRITHIYKRGRIYPHPIKVIVDQNRVEIRDIK